MKGRAIHYDGLELAFIKANASLSRCDLHRLFVVKFNRNDVSVDNIKSLCSRNGWSTGPAGKRRKAGKSLILSESECEWLRDNAALSRSALGPAFFTAHPGSFATVAQLIAWRKRNRVKTGRSGRFTDGHVPWTKGRKMVVHPNAAKTQFQRGQDPHNAVPVGTERINKDGYVLICVDRPNPWTGRKTHMAFKHREQWESINGPVPKGHALKCLDGNKANCDPTNWECVPKGLLPRLNGKSGRNYDIAPAEIKPAIMAVAKLEHALHEAKKG